MERDNKENNLRDASQLEKYAHDLSKVYKSEQEKGKKLEAAYRQLERYADDMNKTISELKDANQELREAYLDTIHRLALAAEYKDEDTGGHIMRMGRYSALIAEKLGLSPNEVKNIIYAAPMHDIGKIGIPDSILLKPGKLTAEEFGIMKTHAIIGANLLAYSKSEILQVAEQIAISHHEKWNGQGYPQGLSGDRIPLVGRITGLADVFDALTSKRPYKEVFSLEKAVDIIKKDRGQHFDPDIVDVFLDNITEIATIKDQVNATEDVRLPNVSYVAKGIDDTK